MKSILKVALEAALAAGAMIRERADNFVGLQIEEKGLHDYVSDVDRDSESLIFDMIRRNFPDHEFVGEESGVAGETGSEFRWIVDPLDGTTNFLRGIPHYAVSIAVEQAGRLQCAVIYDPAKNELFRSTRGGGAYLNDKPIGVSDKVEFPGVLLATGVPFSGINLAEIKAFTSTMEALLAKQTSGIRRLGSAALDLAYVACGRYDGYWEARLNAWDIAAGALLVTEAGGRVTDLAGGDEYLVSGDIVAANPYVIDEIIAVSSQLYQR